MVSKEDRKSYEDGKNDAETAGDPYALCGLLFPSRRPSDPSKAAAYDKGLRGEKLDENKGSSSSGRSCCYLTTACLDAMGIPQEESQELEAIKLVTKEHIMKSRQGKRDYILYRRKAPRIVSGIEARSDSKEIWGRVYERLRDITRTISDGDLERGYQSYKSLVIGLEGQLS